MARNIGASQRDGLWLLKTTETPNQDDGKFRPHLGKTRWSKKQKDMQSNTFAASETEDECLICKQEKGITSCETWRKAVVSDRWKFALCFRWLKNSHRNGRCSLKGTCPVEDVTPGITHSCMQPKKRGTWILRPRHFTSLKVMWKGLQQLERLQPRPSVK